MGLALDYLAVIKPYMSSLKAMLRTSRTEFPNTAPQPISIARNFWRGFFSHDRALRRVRANWERPVQKTPWLADRFFELTRNVDMSLVDDKTWCDLEFPKIFSMVDSAVTPIGTQYLYRQMRTMSNLSPADVERNVSEYEFLISQDRLRELLQVRLLPLSHDSSALACETIYGEIKRPPSWAALAFVLSTLSIICCLLMPITSFGGWAFFICVLMNLVFLFFSESHFHDIYSAASRLSVVVGVANTLIKITGAENLSYVRRAGSLIAALPTIRRDFRWFGLKRDDSLLGSLLFYLQVLFLIDICAGLVALKRINYHRAHLADAFELVGAIDAVVAISSWLRRSPGYCRPQIVHDRQLEIENGYHPLTEFPVRNTVTLRGRSALILGSNMSGKTTFIKMVGVNAIVAQTLGICFAQSAVIPAGPVITSISNEHSIESGRSHFFVEIERILHCIHSAESAYRGVYLIDEIFRGTNTPERIAAAKAVLGSLASNAQVLATTHDVELQEYLGLLYTIFHFKENPDLPSIFDYKLYCGVGDSRNAIRLLERVGFPSTIVTEANRLLIAAGSTDQGSTAARAGINLPGTSR